MSGYLALLLSKLLTCAKSSYDLIIPYLPGSTRQEKLDSLLTSLNELSGLQSVLHRKLGEMASSDKETYPALAESEKLERDADVLECAKEELKSFIATIP